ncbi:XdhC family protein [Bermanella sp. R86510]|uniref:XdhC family protein n=1 Tax=unclassified Bermanella TaxID=2627862 RepID=UPI0037CB2E03
MQGSQLDVLYGCLDCVTKQNDVTLVSVAKTWGTSPRPVGSLLAISSDGRFFGSVSGGCVEEDLIERLSNKPVSQATTLIYGENQSERDRFRLPCGGTLTLVAEPFNQRRHIEQLINAIEQRKTQIRTTNLTTQDTTLQSWHGQHPKLVTTNNQLIWQNVLGPMWRLIIVGAGETGQYLAQFAQGIGFDIVVSDPRPEYRSNWPLSNIELENGFPDDVIDSLNVDSRTAIVTIAHDPKVDDMALLSALKSPAFYVGALGSKQNNQARRQRLMEHFDFTQSEVDKLHGPVGLDIGSKQPSEIALSIMAHIVAVKNGK